VDHHSTGPLGDNAPPFGDYRAVRPIRDDGSPTTRADRRRVGGSTRRPPSS